MTKSELCRLEQAELVKLIDEGQLVYLPCKEGDILYCIYTDRLQDMKKSANEQPKPFLKITEGKINSILIDKNSIRYLLNIVTPSTAFESEFGKTVFLTREEAEKALKERDK